MKRHVAPTLLLALATSLTPTLAAETPATLLDLDAHATRIEPLQITVDGTRYQVVDTGLERFPFLAGCTLDSDSASSGRQCLPDILTGKRAIQAQHEASQATLVDLELKPFETGGDTVERIFELAIVTADLTGWAPGKSGGDLPQSGYYEALSSRGISDSPRIAALLERLYDGQHTVADYGPAIEQLRDSAAEFLEQRARANRLTQQIRAAKSKISSNAVTSEVVFGFSENVRELHAAYSGMHAAAETIGRGIDRLAVDDVDRRTGKQVLAGVVPVAELADLCAEIEGDFEHDVERLARRLATAKAAGKRMKAARADGAMYAQGFQSYLRSQLDHQLAHVRELVGRVQRFDAAMTDLGISGNAVAFERHAAALQEHVQAAEKSMDLDPLRSLLAARRAATRYEAVSSALAGDPAHALMGYVSEKCPAEDSEQWERIQSSYSDAMRNFREDKPIEGIKMLTTLAETVRDGTRMPRLERTTGDERLEEEDLEAITILPPPIDPFQNPWVLGVLAAVALLPLLVLLFVIRRLSHKGDEGDDPAPGMLPTQPLG